MSHCYIQASKLIGTFEGPNFHEENHFFFVIYQPNLNVLKKHPSNCLLPFAKRGSKIKLVLLWFLIDRSKFPCRSIDLFSEDVLNQMSNCYSWYTNIWIREVFAFFFDPTINSRLFQLHLVEFCLWNVSIIMKILMKKRNQLYFGQIWVNFELSRLYLRSQFKQILLSNLRKWYTASSV